MSNTANHCKINCKLRYFYSKGAFLILSWNTLIYMGICYVIRHDHVLFQGIKDTGAYSHLTLVPTMFVFSLTPLAGWLADSKLGNYRVFKLGCFILFLAAVIFSICVLILENISNHTLSLVISGGVVPIMYALGACGLACNITALQLGLDQMPDASSANVTSFLAWFVCSAFGGFWISEILYYIPHFCTENNVWQNQLLSLLPVLCMTFVCCSVLLSSSKRLIIEPESTKALTTIYQVLKFAAKHKAPLNRSAFTYWEEDIPSRLDLGKSKYGGPFTTEQVENVKTILKIFVIQVPIALVSLSLSSTQSLGLLNNIYDCASGLEYALAYSPWWSVVLTTVLYELAVYPLIRNIVPSTLKRVGIVSFLVFLVNSGYLLMSVCKFVRLVEYSESQWPHIVYFILFGVNATFLINGMLEFVCAQSPYNIRGLLAGCTVLLLVFWFSFGALVFWLFYALCDRAYSFTAESSFTTISSLVGFILHCVLAHWYKRRVRDEDYPAHRVVEEVYDRYLSHVHTVDMH